MSTHELYLFHTALQSTPHHKCKCQELYRSHRLDRDWCKLLQFGEKGNDQVFTKEKLIPKTQWITYAGTEAHSHSTVHQTGRFYCLIPAVCSLHHRCRSLQSCRWYWRDCVDHLWECQDHHSQQLGTKQELKRLSDH